MLKDKKLIKRKSLKEKFIVTKSEPTNIIHKIQYPMKLHKVIVYMLH